MKLMISDLNAGYGERPVLHNVSFSVNAGEIMALIGPNGAGKTTIIRAICGGLTHTEGQISVDGKDIKILSPSQRARLIAVVPQARQLGGAYTVWQAVMMGRTAYMGWLGRESENDVAAVKDALEKTHLSEFKDRPIAQLSGGEQQRVLLARALAQSTPVLLLDEPTNHLDLRHQTELLKLIKVLIKEKKLAVVFAMHDLNLVSAVANQVALLVDGHIITCGAPSETLTAEQISAAYGLPISVIKDPEGNRPLIFPRDLFNSDNQRKNAK